MPKVYVTQETRHDFAPAEQYGEVMFIAVDRSDDFHNVVNSEHNMRLLAHLSHQLREFNEDEDYLVITGGVYVNAAVFWLLGRKQVKTLKLLRWDNRGLQYIPLMLQLRKETIDNEQR